MTDDEIDLMTDDEFWAHLLGDNDPCAPGKDWQNSVKVAIVSAIATHPSPVPGGDA